MNDSDYEACAATMEAHHDAENEQDLAGIMATWSTIEEVTLSYNRIAVHGLAAVEHNYAARVGHLPAFKLEEIARWRGEDAIISEMTMHFDDGDEHIATPFVVIYTFDREHRVVEERLLLNELPIAPYFYPHLWKNRVGGDPSIQERALKHNG